MTNTITISMKDHFEIFNAIWDMLEKNGVSEDDAASISTDIMKLLEKYGIEPDTSNVTEDFAKLVADYGFKIALG